MKYINWLIYVAIGYFVAHYIDRGSYFIAYMLIGFGVSYYFINHFRLTGKTPPKKTDAFFGMIGPFIWPLQILFFFVTKKYEK